MTDCEQALREIEAYLDGELEPSSLRELEVHFEDCTPCADRADFQRKLKSLIAGKCASAPSVPPGLRARIDEMLRGEHTR
jgi:mycothiol system anti-sigma-R factor